MSSITKKRIVEWMTAYMAASRTTYWYGECGSTEKAVAKMAADIKKMSAAKAKDTARSHGMF